MYIYFVAIYFGIYMPWHMLTKEQLETIESLLLGVFQRSSLGH